MRAPRVPVRTKHEVIDNELAAAREQLRQRLAALRALKLIILCYRLPGEPSPLLAQLLAQAGEFLLLRKQCLPRLDPVLMRYHFVHDNLLNRRPRYSAAAQSRAAIS